MMKVDSGDGRTRRKSSATVALENFTAIGILACVMIAWSLIVNVYERHQEISGLRANLEEEEKRREQRFEQERLELQRRTLETQEEILRAIERR